MQGLWLGTWLRYLAGNRLAPYVAMPPRVVQELLNLTEVRSSDRVYDIGCGDGRILVAAAQRGAQCCGYEINPKLAKEARRNAELAGVARLVTVHEQDALQADLTSASVVTLFLTEGGNKQLMPKFKDELSPNARVVSWLWEMEGMEPTRAKRVGGVGMYVYTGSQFRQC
jgi:16S rRNA A1518/A1519 N6-dimethyltransferase RsmA/KsgA/DIM1 with predicted DNA glycosylase/AP lyase activity